MRRLSRGIAVLSLLTVFALPSAHAAIWDGGPHNGPSHGIVKILKKLFARIFDDGTDMSTPHP